MSYRIPAAIIAIVTALVGGQMYFGAAKEPKITLENPQKVVWERPTTDEQWAKDVKAENFDIKSTGKLEEMRDTHAAKLTRVQDGMAEIFECRECVEFKLRKANREWSEQDIDNEYLNQLAHAQWEVEKLQQSVERMDKELELRDKGFVVVEGGKRKAINFGGTVPPERIRHIND